MQYVIIFLLLLCSSVYAAPEIDSVGSSISGSGFGSKSTAEPTTWDNFEDGVCSAATPTVGYDWNSLGLLKISTIQKRGDASAHHNFTTTGAATAQSNNSILSRKWFVQMWLYIDQNFDWGTSSSDDANGHLSNVKFFRMWNPGAPNENFLSLFGWGLTDGALSNTENLTVYQANNYMSLTKNDITKETWHCMQFEFLDSSDVLEYDAEYRVWFDGALVEEWVGFLAKEDYSDEKRVNSVGFYNAWQGGAAATGENDFYIDDIYVDITWSRVEVGNNSVYNSCTHREIQPYITSWSDTQITLSAWNQGSFSNGEQVYLFVIDSDGNASAGYAGYFLDGQFYSMEVSSSLSNCSITNGTIQ